ncbi:hypothetical protein IJU97_05755, partial [bacterium]|nr:hypothetical protein [bacterium]
SSKESITSTSPVKLSASLFITTHSSRHQESITQQNNKLNNPPLFIINTNKRLKTSNYFPFLNISFTANPIHQQAHPTQENTTT